MTKRLLQRIAELVTKAGLLPAFLSIVEKWAIRRTSYAFPFALTRKYACYQILQYHRVNNEHDFLMDSVPIKVFARQMEMLRKFFNVLPLEELVERAGKSDIPARAIAITFDDGYRDNYQNAFPILKRLNLPATIFVTTGAIDSDAPLWHDTLFNAFWRTQRKAISINGTEYPLNTVTEKRYAVDALRQYLRSYPLENRNTLIHKITAQLEVPVQFCSNELYLSWDQIREMSHANITFGAHTVTHPILTQLSAREMTDEITISKTTLERQLGCPVRLFAYPNGGRGDFDEGVKRVLKEADFLCAVTILWGTNNLCTDPFELRRQSLWDFDPQLSMLKLGWYKLVS